MEQSIEKIKPSSNLEIVNYTVQQLGEEKELVSDGFHTFKELYEIRLAYNVALFNELYLKNQDTGWQENPYEVHKSWRHYDGELCFGGGWFIVVAQLPSGQISNHYEAIHWDKFRIPETEKALFEYDGHTTNDVIERLIKL